MRLKKNGREGKNLGYFAKVFFGFFPNDDDKEFLKNVQQEEVGVCMSND